MDVRICKSRDGAIGFGRRGHARGIHGGSALRPAACDSPHVSRQHGHTAAVSAHRHRPFQGRDARRGRRARCRPGRRRRWRSAECAATASRCSRPYRQPAWNRSPALVVSTTGTRKRRDVVEASPSSRPARRRRRAWRRPARAAARACARSAARRSAQPVMALRKAARRRSRRRLSASSSAVRGPRLVDVEHDQRAGFARPPRRRAAPSSTSSASSSSARPPASTVAVELVGAQRQPAGPLPQDPALAAHPIDQDDRGLAADAGALRAPRQIDALALSSDALQRAAVVVAERSDVRGAQPPALQRHQRGRHLAAGHAARRRRAAAWRRHRAAARRRRRGRGC